MRIYAHLTIDELRAKRDQLLAAIESAASGVASASYGGRMVTYKSNLAESYKLLEAINAEIALREGAARPNRPLYLVG